MRYEKSVAFYEKYLRLVLYALSSCYEIHVDDDGWHFIRIGDRRIYLLQIFSINGESVEILPSLSDFAQKIKEAEYDARVASGEVG